MPLVSMRQLLDEAALGGFGVGAFNVNNIEGIRHGVRHGVRKINVDTDSRLAVTGAIRKVLAESPEQFDPRNYLKPARAAMQELTATRRRDFGQAGHAGEYEPLSLEQMRDGYATAAAVA